MLADFENFLEKKDLTFLTFFCRAFEPVENYPTALSSQLR